jgi:exonuclease III
MEDYKMRIITFNILTHDYCYQSHYKHVKSEYLNNSYRENRVIKLLQSWMKANFIINLQEVGSKWKIILEDFFEKSGYDFVSKVYANDKMGVGIAYPKKHFKLDKIYCEDLNKFIEKLEPSDIDVLNEYDTAKNKELIILGLGLECFYKGTNTNKKVMIMNCHLPLKYKLEYYMMTILWKIRNICYELSNSYRIILSGDFNITPKSIYYDFMLDNLDKLDELDNFNIKSKIIKKIIGKDYDNIIKFNSAYNECHSCEPNYTNVYKNNDIIFCDCLDYIFIDNSISVISSIVGLLNKDPLKYLYPNAICPSDHVPLSASLSI